MRSSSSTLGHRRTDGAHAAGDGSASSSQTPRCRPASRPPTGPSNAYVDRSEGWADEASADAPGPSKNGIVAWPRRVWRSTHAKPATSASSLPRNPSGGFRRQPGFSSWRMSASGCTYVHHAIVGRVTRARVCANPSRFKKLTFSRGLATLQFLAGQQPTKRSGHAIEARVLVRDL